MPDRVSILSTEHQRLITIVELQLAAWTTGLIPLRHQATHLGDPRSAHHALQLKPLHLTCTSSLLQMHTANSTYTVGYTVFFQQEQQDYTQIHAALRCCTHAIATKSLQQVAPVGAGNCKSPMCIPGSCHCTAHRVYGHP